MDEIEFLTYAEAEALTALQAVKLASWKRQSKSRVKYYFGMRLNVDKGVFPPRGDSIALGQVIGREIQRHQRVLDFGTGSGNLAILAGRKAYWDCSPRGVGPLLAIVDNSKRALECARGNLERFGFGEDAVESYASLKPLLDAEKRFDWIVCNPPFRWAEQDDGAYTLKKRFGSLATMFVDIEGVAHRALLENGHDLLREKGGILLNVSNYPESGRVLELMAQTGWGSQLKARRAFHLRSADNAEVLCLETRVYHLWRPASRSHGK